MYGDAREPVKDVHDGGIMAGGYIIEPRVVGGHARIHANVVANNAWWWRCSDGIVFVTNVSNYDAKQLKCVLLATTCKIWMETSQGIFKIVRIHKLISVAEYQFH